MQWVRCTLWECNRTLPILMDILTTPIPACLTPTECILHITTITRWVICTLDNPVAPLVASGWCLRLTIRHRSITINPVMWARLLNSRSWYLLMRRGQGIFERSSFLWRRSIKGRISIWRRSIIGASRPDLPNFMSRRGRKKQWLLGSFQPAPNKSTRITKLLSKSNIGRES